jgi:predicted alpha/beta superfamily hydrolase
MRHVLVFGSLLMIAAAGCASTPLKTDNSSAAIRAAEEVGAKDVPRAALHLQLAKESLDRATKLYAQGDKDEARSLLTRAEADGELAVVLSREDAEKQEAVKAVERVHQLELANPERSTP